jgi:hypothetical protein
MKGERAINEMLPSPVLLNYGGAKKFIAEMNAEELEKARQSIMQRAREKAFSKGLPVYYHHQGILVAEFPDGRIEALTANPS